MDNDRIDKFIEMIGSDLEYRIMRDIIGDLTKEEKEQIRNNYIQKLLNYSGNLYQIDLDMKSLINDATKSFLTSYKDAFYEKTNQRMKQYLEQSYIDKIVDSYAPVALSNEIKRVVETIASKIRSGK